MSIEKRARRAICEMAQAPDRGYTREEVLVTFLQSEYVEGRLHGVNVGRDDAAKWCDLQADLAKAVTGNRTARMLAEERELVYVICAEHFRRNPK